MPVKIKKKIKRKRRQDNSTQTDFFDIYSLVILKTESNSSEEIKLSGSQNTQSLISPKIEKNHNFDMKSDDIPEL